MIIFTKFNKIIMKLLLIIPLYLISFSVFGQSIENYDFIGTLILENKALISYRVQFDIYNSEIIGYSFTDLNGTHETKSKIKGIYDEKEKNIIIKESEILYTKSNEIEDIFCFIHIDARIKLKNNKQSIQGNFTGVYKNNDTCATGKISMISLKDAFKKLEKVSKKVNKLKKIDSVTKEKLNAVNFLSDIKMNSIKKNEVLTVFWKSGRFILEVWDNGKEDGDLISVKINNKSVLQKYEVKKEKKRIEFNLVEGNNSIDISADNNGEIFPNTAKVTLIDGTEELVMTSSLEAGETSKINIIYKEK